MNRMQWEAVVHRLRQMEERLPEGSFDRLALEQARKAAQSKIPAKVRYGGGAWRCPRCNAVVRPMAKHCENCGKRLTTVNERRRNA
ncbi:hypothetical protein B5G03_07130 [Gemmiger sp. An50]|nr:hypothetical protein B5G03_07130 [Gemmiger sp. An50]